MLGPAVGGRCGPRRSPTGRPPAPTASSFTPPPSIRHFEHAELLLDPATVPTGDADDARIAGHVRPIERARSTPPGSR